MATPESNVWEAPVNTEGVTATDQPASPGEQVATAPDAAEQQAQPEGQPTPEAKPTDPAAPAERLDWTTAPEAFRAAHEAEKPLRELVKEVGGLEVLREAVELDDLLRNPAVGVDVKLQRLHALSESEFQRIGKELLARNWRDEAWQDHLLTERFGKTAAEIEALLKGSPSQEQEPPFDPVAYARDLLADPMASEHDKGLARHAIAQAEEAERQREALARVSGLEERVKSFDQLQTERQTEQRNLLAGEFLQTAFAPVDEVIKAAGLAPVAGDSEEEAARKAYATQRLQQDVFNDLYGNAIADPNHPNHALAKELDGYLSNLDRTNAWRKLPKVQALAEMAAQRYAKYLSATYSQQRKVQSQPLEREPNPPVVNGQGSSFGQQDPLPPGREVWEDQTMPERWREIAAS